MNLKSLLVTALLFVIFMGFMSFGYLTYAIYMDGTSQAGAQHVMTHQLLFYAQVILQVAAFGLGVGIFFKA